MQRPPEHLSYQQKWRTLLMKNEWPGTTAEFFITTRQLGWRKNIIHWRRDGRRPDALIGKKKFLVPLTPLLMSKKFSRAELTLLMMERNTTDYSLQTRTRRRKKWKLPGVSVCALEDTSGERFCRCFTQGVIPNTLKLHKWKLWTVNKPNRNTSGFHARARWCFSKSPAKEGTLHKTALERLFLPLDMIYQEGTGFQGCDAAGAAGSPITCHLSKVALKFWIQNSLLHGCSHR